MFDTFHLRIIHTIHTDLFHFKRREFLISSVIKVFMFLSITYAVNVTATNRYLQYDGLAQKYGVKHACKWSNPAVLKQTNTYTAGTSHLQNFRCMCRVLNSHVWSFVFISQHCKRNVWQDIENIKELNFSSLITLNFKNKNFIC